MSVGELYLSSYPHNCLSPFKNISLKQRIFMKLLRLPRQSGLSDVRNREVGAILTPLKSCGIYNLGVLVGFQNIAYRISCQIFGVCEESGSRKHIPVYFGLDD
jgi:hypothetical protein